MKFQSLILATSVIALSALSEPAKAQETIENDSCYWSALRNFGDCLSKDVPREIPEIPKDGGQGLGSALSGCIGQFGYRTSLCMYDDYQKSNLSNSQNNTRNGFEESTGGYSADPYIYDGGYSQDPYATDIDGDGVPDQSYDPYGF